jgi:hypothetical protein
VTSPGQLFPDTVYHPSYNFNLMFNYEIKSWSSCSPPKSGIKNLKELRLSQAFTDGEGSTISSINFKFQSNGQDPL